MTADNYQVFEIVRGHLLRLRAVALALRGPPLQSDKPEIGHFLCKADPLLSLLGWTSLAPLGFKELYIRDYGGFRINKVECSGPPEASSRPVPWADCRRFQLRFADEPVSSCNSAGHRLRSGQPQRVRHEGKTRLLRPSGYWTGRV